ncbi:MAG: hypothetical protein QNK33_03085 [Bacteroidales bacterium]|nr:hypothetical protein [Bacteroidales bacterium]
MSTINNNSNLVICKSCCNDIPLITKHLQSKPTASNWKKYGMCCASCSASEALISYRARKNYDKGSSSIDSHVHSFYDNAKAEYTSNNFSRVSGNRISDPKRLVRARYIIGLGEIMILSGLIGGILLLYSEWEVRALFGLFIIIAGFIIYRRGICIKRYEEFECLSDPD